MSTILVIEDDLIMIKSIKNILTKDGHVIITANDGKEAFNKTDTEQFDIAIIDIVMPYVNGLEVITRIRNDSSKNHIGILVCSAIGTEKNIIESFKLGTDDFLKKPFLADELRMRIKKIEKLKKSS